MDATTEHSASGNSAVEHTAVEDTAVEHTAVEHTAVEHTDRGPLSTEELAAVIGRDIPAGAYVNLGIGQPTKIADHLPADADGTPAVILHTENGMLGMGPAAHGDDIDPDLTNAGKVPVTELPGASYFHHADSFAMMRGGHLDVCVLGAYQVSAGGDLANWHTGKPDDIPAVGGAMDLAIGAKDVYQAGRRVQLPADRGRLRQPRLHRLRGLRHPAGRRARPGHLRDQPGRTPRPDPGQAPRLTWAPRPTSASRLTADPD
jgi:3-oxoadipate CoA-transferase beta subunit